MKRFLVLLLFAVTTFAHAQTDTARKFHRVRFGLYSSLSYQFILNGNDAQTNMGNVAFKGRLNPSIGIGIRYQQDSTEYALVTASAAFLDYSVSAINTLTDNTGSYELVHRYGMAIANFSLEASYHHRLKTFSPRTSLGFECGAGIHVLNWAGAVYACDSAVGPYTLTCTFESNRNYHAIPSAQLGLNLNLKSFSHRTEYIFGLRSQLYLAKFSEVQYDLQYTSPSQTVNYYFHYAPVILTPKAYVMVVF